MEEEHFPTLEELEARKAALKADGKSTHTINTLINQKRPIETLRAEIAMRRAERKPTDRLEAEVWLRENGIFG